MGADGPRAHRDQRHKHQPRFPRRNLLVIPYDVRHHSQRVRVCARPPQNHALPLRRDGGADQLHGRRRRRGRMEHKERDARDGDQHVLRDAICELGRDQRRRQGRDVGVCGWGRVDDVWVCAEWGGLGCVCVTDVVSARVWSMVVGRGRADVSFFQVGADVVGRVEFEWGAEDVCEWWCDSGRDTCFHVVCAMIQ